jgi:VanZ family protein
MVHLCAYFILGYLVRRALDRGRTPGHSPVTVGMVLCVVWALADELHQTFVPLRSPEVWDFLADVAGSGAGIAVSHVRQRTEDRLAKGEQDGNGS